MPRYLKVAHQRKSDGSLFTEADLAAQEALTRALQAIHPGPVVGEEMTEEQQVERWLAGDAGLWCVDPIDGTSNFVNGLPYFAVSVALMKQGRSVLGVVYDPVADEVFHAERAAAPGSEWRAAADQARMSRTSATPWRTWTSSGWASGSGRRAGAAPPYSSQRNYGAGTLEWCYLAAGRFDLYLHGGQKLWDYAAGALILEEAGGCMCTLDPRRLLADDLWRRSVIAARDPGLFVHWKNWMRARHLIV